MFHRVVGFSVFVSMRCWWPFSTFWCSTHQVSCIVFCQYSMFRYRIRFDFHTFRSLWQADHATQQTFAGLEDVLIMFSTRLQRNNFSSSKTSWRRLANTSWRRLEDVLKTSRKTSWRRIGRRKVIRWRRLQVVFKTCLEDVFKTFLEGIFNTCLECVFETCFQDVLETNKIFTGDICV